MVSLYSVSLTLCLTRNKNQLSFIQFCTVQSEMFLRELLNCHNCLCCWELFSLKEKGNSTKFHILIYLSFLSIMSWTSYQCDIKGLSFPQRQQWNYQLWMKWWLRQFNNFCSWDKIKCTIKSKSLLQTLFFVSKNWWRWFKCSFHVRE